MDKDDMGGIVFAAFVMAVIAVVAVAPSASAPHCVRKELKDELVFNAALETSVIQSDWVCTAWSR